MNDTDVPQSSIAVFIDYENLALGTGKRKRNGHQEPGPLPDVKLIFERLVDKGRITTKRAYCDWQRFSDAVTPLHAHHLGCRDIIFACATGSVPGNAHKGLGILTDQINLTGRNPLAEWDGLHDVDTPFIDMKAHTTLICLMTTDITSTFAIPIVMVDWASKVST